MKHLSLFLALAAASVAITAAQAETWAYTDPGPGNQTWTGNLGLDFRVNSSIIVTGLGIFNASGASSIIGGPIQVGIFDLNAPANSGPLVSATFVNSLTYAIAPGPYDLNQAVNPLLLGPGDYSVVAVGYGNPDPNGNQHFGSPGPVMNDGGGLISFIGTGRYDSNTTLDLPGIIDVSSGDPPSGPNIYDAGTFEFEAAAPEPGTLGLLGLGVGGLGLFHRRRSRRSTT